MALPSFDMRQLLEAGVHFGHQTHRWNPKMGNYIYGARNNIHIIDLGHTVGLLEQALLFLSGVAAKGGRILFVGTKRQASDVIAESAGRCAQYYINQRWLGGTLTNWKTITDSIKRLKKLEGMLSAEAQGFTKKELLQLTRERDKLERAIGGIKDMGGRPDALFIIDTNKESIAIAEAKKLGIPVVAVIDTNSNPDHIDYPIPGNDDAGRAIALYCDLAVRAIVDGIERGQAQAGVDIGAKEQVPVEAALDAAPKEAPAAKKVEAPKAEVKETKAKPAAKKAEPKKDKPKEAKTEAAKEEKPAAKKETAKKEPTKKATGKEDAAKKDATEKEAKEKSPAKKETKAEAKPKRTFVGLKKPEGEADDLKQISGVGPKAEEKLNELGIFHFWQINDLKKEHIEEIEDELGFKGRITRDEWKKQAKALAKDKK